MTQTHRFFISRFQDIGL